MDAHADDLMLSELLISLHGSPVAADYSAGAMEASCTTAPAGAAPPHHQQHCGSGRRTAAGAGVSAKASAAGRRTVVHRRKRRDDLAGPCNHCGALTSPQWRKGPKGKPVLCNACGIRFLRNRTLTKVMVGGHMHAACLPACTQQWSTGTACSSFQAAARGRFGFLEAAGLAEQRQNGIKNSAAAASNMLLTWPEADVPVSVFSCLPCPAGAATAQEASPWHGRRQAQQDCSCHGNRGRVPVLLPG